MQAVPFIDMVLARRELARRNQWIDNSAVSVLGLTFGAMLLGALNRPAAVWQASALLTLPFLAMTAFVLLVTLPRGLGRLREFWSYHRLRHGLGDDFLIWCYAPLALIGAISAVKIWW